jgi:hypothetical protein
VTGIFRILRSINIVQVGPALMWVLRDINLKNKTADAS